jgi:small subunit ribosomal protein S3
MIERAFIRKSLGRMEMEDYLTKKLDRAGFSRLEIIKTPLVTRIVLYVAKPGMAIGKSGSTIKQLTDTMATKYKIDNPQIEIQEIRCAALDAKVQAEKMASMVEKGFQWRSIAFRTVKDAMDAGAQGVELVVKGKLSGKGGRKRKQRVAYGYLKKIGHQARMVDFAKAAAYPKAGAIGIRLKIVRPDVIFPDKVDVLKVIRDIKGVEKEKKEQAEKALEKAKEKADGVKEELAERDKLTEEDKGKDAEKAKEALHKVLAKEREEVHAEIKKDISAKEKK